MKKHLLCTAITVLFLSLLSLQSFSQQIEVNWGPIIRVDSKSTPTRVIGKDEEGYYLLRTGKDNVLEKFNNNMQQVFTKELDVYLSKDKKTDFENLYYINGKLMLFTSCLDRQTNTRKLFVSYISKKGEIEPKLFEVNSFPDQDSEKDCYFDINISTDSSKILIFTNFKEVKKAKERFHYKVIDETLLVQAQAFVELPYEGVHVSIQKYIVDNAGNIHMLYWVNLKLAEEGNVANDDRIDGNYYLFSYYSSTKETKEYDLRVGTNVISGLDILLDKQNKYIYLAGFYSDKSALAFKGTCLSKIDIQNKSVVYSKTKDLEKDFVALFYKNPTKGKNKTKELYNFETRFGYITGTGELYIVAEQYYVQIVRSYVASANGGGYWVTTYYYHYDHLIALKYDQEGDVEWTAKIPKLQTTVNDGGYYSSIATFAHEGKVYIIYNDNPKNGTNLVNGNGVNGSYTMSQPLKSQTMLVSIDKDGNIQKNVLFAEHDRKSVVRPKFTIQISSNEVIIYGVRGSQYKFGKLTIK